MKKKLRAEGYMLVNILDNEIIRENKNETPHELLYRNKKKLMT